MPVIKSQSMPHKAYMLMEGQNTGLWTKWECRSEADGGCTGQGVYNLAWAQP